MKSYLEHKPEKLSYQIQLDFQRNKYNCLQLDFLEKPTSNANLCRNHRCSFRNLKHWIIKVFNVMKLSILIFGEKSFSIKLFQYLPWWGQCLVERSVLIGDELSSILKPFPGRKRITHNLAGKIKVGFLWNINYSSYCWDSCWDYTMKQEKKRKN